MESGVSCLMRRSPLRGNERWRARVGERRRRPSSAVGRHGLDDEGEDSFALEPAGLNHGEDSLREARPPLTARAEASLPPEDTSSENSLSMVVRRLDPFAPQERPERRLQVQEVLAERGCLLIRGLQPAFQQDLE